MLAGTVRPEVSVREMRRRTVIVMVVAFATTLCGGALVYWAMSEMQRQAVSLEKTTLQKLADGAEIYSNHAEGYARTLLAIQAADPKRRNWYCNQAEEFTALTAASLVRYQTTIPANADTAARDFDRLLKLRQRYLIARAEVFSLVDEPHSSARLKAADETLETEYRNFAAGNAALLAQDISDGRQAVTKIATLANRLKFVAATLCLIAFAAGAAIPLIILADLANRIRTSRAVERCY